MMCVEVDGFAVEDDASLGVWNSSDWAERLFCKTCGTSIGYRMKDGGFVTISAFAFDEPLIMSEVGVGYGQIVSDLFEGLGLRPNMLSVVDNIETQIAIVRSGFGVAFVPTQAALIDATHGTIACVRVTPPPVFDLAFYRRRQALSRTKEAAIRRIPALVRSHIASS